MDTKIPEWVLEANLTFGGSCSGTYGEMGDDSFDQFAAGMVENVTVVTDGVVLEPSLRFNLLNDGEAILENSGSSGWDSTLRFGSALKVGSTYYLYYTGGPDWQYCRIGLATSDDGVNFTKHHQNPILSPTSGERSFANPYVYLDGTNWYMYYSLWDGVGFDINMATSSDGVNWTRYTHNPVIGHGGSSDWDYVLQVADIFWDNGKYRMYYYGYAQGEPMHLATATSADLKNWTKYSGNPLRKGDIDGWEEFRTTYGTVQVLNGSYRLWATSGDLYGDWYLGWMRSDDGLSFTRSEDAVLYPKEGTIYANGVRDPYIFDEGDHYLMLCLCYDSQSVATYGAFRIDKVNHWGTFTSRVMDMKGNVELTAFSSGKNTSGDGNIEIFLRWSIDGITWSDWTSMEGSTSPIGTRARYYQYRADFQTPMEWYKQVLWNVSISYYSYVASIKVRVDFDPFEPASLAGGRWEATVVLDDGGHNVTVQARDTIGGTATITFFVRVDLLPPTGGIVLEKGRRYTNSTTLHYEVWADDAQSVPFFMVSTREDFEGCDWIDLPAMSNGSIVYRGLDGPAFVFVIFKDRVGRTSQIYFDDIMVDLTPPEGRLLIDYGAKYTVDIDVHLGIHFYDMSGVVGLKLSNEPTFFGVELGDPITATAWALEEEEGVHTVYALLVDVVGWETVLEDDIIFDRTPPAASVSINDDAQFTTSRNVITNITLWSEEDVEYQLANDGKPWPLEWLPLAQSLQVPWVLEDGPDGPREVLMRVRDQAGNEVEVGDGIILDTMPPTGSVHIDDDAIYTNDVWVDVVLEAQDVTSGLHRMRVSDSPEFPETPWQNIVTSFEWVLHGDEGPQTLYVQLRDRAGLTTIIRASIILDTVPPSGIVILDGGAKYTPDLEVTVELELFDGTSGLQDMMVSNHEDFTGSEWELLRVSFEWTLEEGDGWKVLYIRVRDDSGLVGNLWGTIVLDTTPPTLTIEVNEGETYTTERTVLLELSVGPDISGVRQMWISFSEDPTGEDWTPFRRVVDLDLDQGDGEKVVYVRVKDGAGHVTIASDSLILDTTPPEGSVAINGGAGFTNNSMVRLSISVVDATSGTVKMRVSEYPVTGEMSWQPLIESMELTFSPGDGERRVYVEFMDAVGWVSNTSSSIVLDTVPPAVEFKAPEKDRSNEERVAFTFTVEDAIDPSPVCEFRLDGGNWRETNGTDFVLSLKEGRHIVEVRATDAAGNSAGDVKLVTVEMPVELSTGRYIILIVVIIVVLLVVTIYMVRRKRMQDPPEF